MLSGTAKLTTSAVASQCETSCDICNSLRFQKSQNLALVRGVEYHRWASVLNCSSSRILDCGSESFHSPLDRVPVIGRHRTLRSRHDPSSRRREFTYPFPSAGRRSEERPALGSDPF